MGGDELIVRKIKEGTVIDHIPAGKSLIVLKILKIKGSEGYKLALVMNVDSRKIGKKDILKIEGRYISDSEASIITLVAPKATLNIVKNYQVVRKIKLKIPQIIRGIIKCPNSMCITNNDPEAKPQLILEKVELGEPVLKCIYCETRVTGVEISRGLFLIDD